MNETKFPVDRLQATAAGDPRRTTHGASGWTLPSGVQALRQPQDGALTQAGSNTQVTIRPINGRSPSSLMEAADARLNGSLRSLARRVKGLNVMPSRPADIQVLNRLAAEPASREPASRKSADSKKTATARPSAHPQVA